jgi:haloalkane dehalogenase
VSLTIPRTAAGPGQPAQVRSVGTDRKEPAVDALRTPDDRFEGLPGWTYEPRYVEVDAGDGTGTRLRVAHVDEGPSDAAPVLLLHGEPSWSYLYRHMLPVLVDAGHRVLAPDLVGFGRSDKPVQQSDYTYARHVGWMLAWLRSVDLTDATLVCQDWGGLIGLRLLAAEPDRFARVVVANTFLPTGDRPPGEAFLAWQRFSQEVEVFDAGAVLQMGTTEHLPDEVVAAYDAPFPDDRYTAGARRFPMLVPTTPDDPAAAANRTAWTVLERWERPFLTAFSDRDPVTKGADRHFRERVPGAAGQPHTTIEGGGHFLQEDRGPELARVVDAFVRSTR